MMSNAVRWDAETALRVLREGMSEKAGLAERWILDRLAEDDAEMAALDASAPGIAGSRTGSHVSDLYPKVKP